MKDRSSWISLMSTAVPVGTVLLITGGKPSLFPKAAGKNVQIQISTFCSLVYFWFVTLYPCNEACKGSCAELNARHVPSPPFHSALVGQLKKKHKPKNELPSSFTNLFQHTKLATGVLISSSETTRRGHFSPFLVPCDVGWELKVLRGLILLPASHTKAGQCKRQKSCRGW